MAIVFKLVDLSVYLTFFLIKSCVTRDLGGFYTVIFMCAVAHNISGTYQLITNWPGWND